MKPAAIGMVHTTCGNEVTKKLQQIPLSNDTVSSSIINKSKDTEEEITATIKTSRHLVSS